MINFLDIDEHQDAAKNIRKKISNETEYGSVEDPLSMHRTASNQTVLVSEIPYVINDENVGAVTVGIFESNLKKTIKRFVAGGNGFASVSSVKRTTACWKPFLCEKKR